MQGSQQIITKNTTSNEISLYKPGKVDPQTWAIGSKMLINAFPKLPIEWFDLLKSLISEENFSNQKFLDSVRHLIKTCPYPEPTIANLLSYDKTVKSHTYEEILEINSKYPDSMKYFKRLNSGKWVRIEDAEKYNLE